MKKENKELVADILFRELENEFHYDKNSIDYMILKRAFLDFIKSYINGFEKYNYIIELQVLEKE